MSSEQSNMEQLQITIKKLQDENQSLKIQIAKIKKDYDAVLNVYLRRVNG